VEVFLARQPIFDSGLKVYGYELLHRPCRTGPFDSADDDLASIQVLANTLLTFGPATISVPQKRPDKPDNSLPDAKNVLLYHTDSE
jgi:c-di-GMP-related signal transduction protein